MKILIRSGEVKNWNLVKPIEYEGETELQYLISESPSLIPLDEIDESTAVATVAVREFGLPGSGNTDIVLFGPKGDISIIECKLASNPESKRKVIGQILEYAAFLWEMKYEEVDERVTRIMDRSLADLVADTVEGTEWDEEEFRAGVVQTLAAGSFTLIIAVDQINDELSRIIKYLGASVNAGFTFGALEMRRYRSGDNEILVPHLYSSTKPRDRSLTSRRRTWTERELLESIDTNLANDVASVIKTIYAWAKETADKVWLGTGIQKGSFTYHFVNDGKTISVFTIYADGSINLNIPYMNGKIAKQSLDRFYKTVKSIRVFEDIPSDYTRWSTRRITPDYWTDDEFETFKSAILRIREDFRITQDAP